MSEFSIIQRYLNAAPQDDSVALGIGDDAAVLNCPAGHQLVQTVDTMVQNVHFDDTFSPADLAHKVLHVNLSDIAAMAAVPKWATVALTLPDIDENWLQQFSHALHEQSQAHNLLLIGGDTTQGPLSVTLNLTGVVKAGEFLTRRGASQGDDIYVSGTLGDAALALALDSDSGFLHDRLKRPTARLPLGKELYGVASSCIDLSDGLLADLQHICHQSQCGAHIFVEKIPVSTAYQTHFSSTDIDWDFALNGGDDYELCFTAKKSERQEIQNLADKTSCDITRIGEMVNTDHHRVITWLNDQLYHCQRLGWEHFVATSAPLTD